MVVQNFVFAYLNQVYETQYNIQDSIFKRGLFLSSPSAAKQSPVSIGLPEHQSEDTILASISYEEQGQIIESRESFETRSPLFHVPLDQGSSRGSFSEHVSDHDSLPKFQLPIHLLLSDINQHAVALEGQRLKDAADFFTPIVLHHWELSRLLEIIRCQIKGSLVIKEYKYEQEKSELIRISQRLTVACSNADYSKIKQLTSEIQQRNETLLNFKNNIAQHRQKMTWEEIEEQKSVVKESLQAALVLSYLLNVAFRRGMSAPWLSDQAKLEDHQAEYRTLLAELYDIKFCDKDFSSVFKTHKSSIETTKTWEDWGKNLSKVWSFDWNNTPESKTQWQPWWVSRVRDVQAIPRDWNMVRLGGQRGRRLGSFLIPVLQNDGYRAAFNVADPYARWFFSYCNWMFFLPRLSLNISLLGHHLFNESELDPLERTISRMNRFRAHWTRFWFELISDTYWFVNGLLLFTVITGGALSVTGLYLSLIVQTLDLVCAIIRAAVELRRYCHLAAELNKPGTPMSIKEQLRKRTELEEIALGYNVFNFGMLLIGLCLTLPAMAASSAMWPVVGGVCAVLMTFLTYYVNNRIMTIRQNEFENKAPLINP